MSSGRFNLTMIASYTHSTTPTSGTTTWSVTCDPLIYCSSRFSIIVRSSTKCKCCSRQIPWFLALADTADSLVKSSRLPRWASSLHKHAFLKATSNKRASYRSQCNLCFVDKPYGLWNGTLQRTWMFRLSETWKGLGCEDLGRQAQTSCPATLVRSLS